MMVMMMVAVVVVLRLSGNDRTGEKQQGGSR